MSKLCLICGARFWGKRADHECNPRRLARLDAEAERDPDEDEPQEPSVEDRLQLGFEMLSLSGDFRDED